MQGPSNRTQYINNSIKYISQGSTTVATVRWTVRWTVRRLGGYGIQLQCGMSGFRFPLPVVTSLGYIPFIHMLLGSMCTDEIKKGENILISTNK